MLFAKVVSIVIINNRFHILQNVLEVSYVVFLILYFNLKTEYLTIYIIRLQKSCNPIF